MSNLSYFEHNTSWVFVLCNYIHLCTVSYDCQMRKSKGVIDNRCERTIWLMNVKYLRLSTKHFMAIIHVCTSSKIIGIKYRKQNVLPKRKYLSVN